MVTVTIGIPTYNQKKYVESAIESALSQDYPSLEVIVADDCSTDGTDKLVKKYVDDTRFKYVRNKENLGRVKNYRNLLYNLATGDWYLNLDGDDLLLDRTYISRCVNLVTEVKDLVLVYGIRQEVGEDFRFTDLRSTFEEKYSFSIFDGKEFFFSIPGRRNNRLNHLTCLYNRNLAMQIDFYRLPIISADYESLYRLILFGKVGFLNVQAGGWRRHTNNISATQDIKKMIDNYRLFTSVLSFALEKIPERLKDLHRWFVDSVSRKLYTNILSLFYAKKYSEIENLISHCMNLSCRAVIKALFNPKLYIKMMLHILRIGKLLR